MSSAAVRAGVIASLIGMLSFAPAGGQAADQVNIAYIGGTADVGFYIADAKGYLRDEGIEAKFTVFDSAARMVAPPAAAARHSDHDLA
jgi:NitT/TauT family transport system substrate-binding protein